MVGVAIAAVVLLLLSVESATIAAGTVEDVGVEPTAAAAVAADAACSSRFCL